MDNLKKILEVNEVQYEIIQHEKQIRTAQEGAEYFGIEIGQTAPTLIIKSENDAYFTLIVSGDRGRVNIEEVAQLVGCSMMKMASAKEVLKVTGHTVGSVPLALQLPCIVDKKLLRYPFIYGGTGELRSTLKISPEALEKINRVIAFLD